MSFQSIFCILSFSDCSRPQHQESTKFIIIIIFFGGGGGRGGGILRVNEAMSLLRSNVANLLILGRSFQTNRYLKIKKP